ncbi:NADHubiquinone oxidoreductase 6.6kD subunit [Erysiphe neolycopersici]|uniref:NADHubiquinone oxidoreductase 6.6kD subunit n=1 Tax=Erysiphe neolycopersici TaxID=212602 RepID=A0A420HAB4_9PEZI|nr:NADHubiquinone oxidoreductase 6.6kD subunit [Erysiphe neolycopersici]
MAGHHPTPLTLDPAYVKYNMGGLSHGTDMWINRYKYFRWTGRTVKITFAYMVVVPSIIGYLAYTSDGKYNMRGKRRGDTIVER